MKGMWLSVRDISSPLPRPTFSDAPFFLIVCSLLKGKQFLFCYIKTPSFMPTQNGDKKTFDKAGIVYFFKGRSSHYKG